MAKHLIFRAIILLTLTTLFNNCKQNNDKGIRIPNYEKEEKEFLDQIVFNDSILDSLLVWAKPKAIEFGELYLKTTGLDSILIPEEWQSSYTTVSDSEMIQIHQQFTAYQYIKWTEKNLYGLKVLTNEDWDILVHKYNEKGKYLYNNDYRWIYFREKKAKGEIMMSKPIFFDKGNRAFFSFDASWGYCQGKKETNRYIKKNGKWQVDKRLDHVIIC
jgi:hypothetical protein